MMTPKKPKEIKEEESSSKKPTPVPATEGGGGGGGTSEPPKPILKDMAIHVSWPDATSKIGKEDNSPIAQFARDNGYGEKDFPAGHSGVILIDRETGKTSYTDFGRYPGAPAGKGKTRINQPGLATLDAQFDDKGNLTNADEIVRSLMEGNEFLGHYNDHVEYQTVGDVVYEDMYDFAVGRGIVSYGFGKSIGQTYCTDFACDVLKAGGVIMKDWGTEKLLTEAEKIIKTEKNKYLLKIKIFNLIRQGPTGTTVNRYLKSLYPSLPNNEIKK